MVMNEEQRLLPSELGKLSDEDLIADEQVAVTLTAANYIKRSPTG